jgi:hypothetical protein
METKKPGQSVLTDPRKGRSYKSDKTDYKTETGWRQVTINEASSPKL